MNEETKKKISESRKGHSVSAETREKISKIHKGKTITDAHKIKISESSKDRWSDDEFKQKMISQHSGREFSDEHRTHIGEAVKKWRAEKPKREVPVILCKCGCGETVKTKGAKYCRGHNARDQEPPSSEHREKISQALKGHTKSDEWKTKMSKRQKGISRPNWKSVYVTQGISLFQTYADRLQITEEIRQDPEDCNILNVKCTYCGKWIRPTISQAQNRLSGIKGQPGMGECRFYCQGDRCKSQCSIFNRIKYPKGYNTRNLANEVLPQLRKIVLARDNYTCTKCGTTDVSLHCHHIVDQKCNPMEAADIDSCTTLCVDCHKEAHQKDGCKTGQLASYSFENKGPLE